MFNVLVGEIALSWVKWSGHCLVRSCCVRFLPGQLVFAIFHASIPHNTKVLLKLISFLVLVRRV